ncbi:hypothetical protein LEN26_010588 [Aphanomyces euteiches]|nr:hypothetical protein AeMF1_018177 [Aphanomyces euteiches]KAH9121568.1 hypothetical protein LEN26_010588 [Aphanomyces euteiches]KAH9195079.1 hypothetical protein AeNC1_002966 [Aphanomyces euteiches]
MSTYVPWTSVEETIQKEATKVVYVYFDTPSGADKTEKIASKLGEILGPHRTDLIQTRVDASQLDTNQLANLGVTQVPFIQLYYQGKLKAGLDASHAFIDRLLLPQIGWYAGDKSHEKEDALTPVDYVKLTEEIERRTLAESDFLANCSNVSAAIWDAFKQAGRPVNWAGFYLNRPIEGTEKRLLILGPFQGKPACTRIEFHRGVCGACASTRRVQRVPVVKNFPGHIACDDASQSEIVLPIIVNGELIGLLDMDCPNEYGFTIADAAGLQAIVDLFAARTHWESFNLSVRTAPIEEHDH